MMIGLLGDYIIDQYIYGTCDRLSPESPIPVFKETRRETRGGGVENVFQNLKAFGVDIEYHFSQNSIKTRYVSGNHILFRNDNERYIPSTQIDFDLKSKYVILSDYDKGFIHRPEALIDSLKRHGKFVIVDPKKPIWFYCGADIVKMNEKEWADYVIDKNNVCERWNIGTIVVTRGSKSVLIIDALGSREIPVDSHPVSDVTGAGDVFIAAMTVFLCRGDVIDEAVRKAAKLASISVTKFGTYVLTEEDIRTVCPKIVFTNGCFDILHRGHIEYLKKSKSFGDKLIVGLNSDASVHRLKGFNRPVNKQEDRKAVLENLGCVDEVIIFDEDTPYELIKQVKPDIITKGGDYVKETVVGNDLAEVVIVDYLNGYSTTKILERT
jgi:D-beta-D-heptose 7-phosphate kinase / D-beta-D-heptose 1-phosphate adenosyltransferase